MPIESQKIRETGYSRIRFLVQEHDAQPEKTPFRWVDVGSYAKEENVGIDTTVAIALLNENQQVETLYILENLEKEAGKLLDSHPELNKKLLQFTEIIAVAPQDLLAELRFVI